MRRSGLGFALLMVVCAACGSSPSGNGTGNSPDPGTSIDSGDPGARDGSVHDGGSPTATCEEFASALCTRLYACNHASLTVTSTSECISAQKSRCEGMMTAPGSHFDSTAVARCAGGLAA